jgi:NAD(P)-dependent dehydrogenase (short-subunit alcohol dehydrogenase family)
MNRFVGFFNRGIERVIRSLMIVALLVTSQASFGSEANSEEATDQQQQTVLITGANRGIGLALATHFHQHGYKVIATARKPTKALELNKVGVEVVQLDITDTKSVTALKSKLKGRQIDILLNNAGIGGHSTANFEDLDIERLQTAFNVNSLGALRVIQALMPNLDMGPRKIVASVSSRMGSIKESSGGAIGYRASKTALNSFNKSLSVEFAKQGFVFVVLHPGWVRTDMTSSNATYSTKESAQGLFKVITGLSKADNGRFYDLHGKSIAW